MLPPSPASHSHPAACTHLPQDGIIRDGRRSLPARPRLPHPRCCCCPHPFLPLQDGIILLLQQELSEMAGVHCPPAPDWMASPSGTRLASAYCLYEEPRHDAAATSGCGSSKLSEELPQCTRTPGGNKRSVPSRMAQQFQQQQEGQQQQRQEEGEGVEEGSLADCEPRCLPSSSSLGGGGEEEGAPPAEAGSAEGVVVVPSAEAFGKLPAGAVPGDGRVAENAATAATTEHPDPTEVIYSVSAVKLVHQPGEAAEVTATAVSLTRTAAVPAAKHPQAAGATDAVSSVKAAVTATKPAQAAGAADVVSAAKAALRPCSKADPAPSEGGPSDPDLCSPGSAVPSWQERTPQVRSRGVLKIKPMIHWLSELNAQASLESVM